MFTKITLAAALLLPVVSFADSDDFFCPQYPKNQRMDARQLQQKLLQAGHLILEFEYDNHCYEVEVLEPNNQKATLSLDAKTGATLHRQSDLF